MSKVLVLLLFVGSIGLAGWEFHDYSNSGEEISVHPLQGNSGEVGGLRLTSVMSPVRVLVTVDYEINIQDETNNAYEYVVEVLDPLGRKVGNADGSHVVKREDQGPNYEASRMTHIADTFDVITDGLYQANWSLKQKKANIRGASLKFRRNVRSLNWSVMALAGGCFLLGWVVVFSKIRNRKN
ncbi:hypothetical protein [Sneathiella aquimaris]|uniref:hypothetical protein n=1 Tax=Sneathiella aquimaris TaxID=2599305 RepID=UPI00146ABC96|nr:hypothetical protein [Sneathiella aquimaris]